MKLKQEEAWVNDFRKLMIVEVIGNLELMRSNNFLVAVGFIRSLLMQCKEEVREAYKGDTKRIWYQQGYKEAEEKLKRELRAKLEKMKMNRESYPLDPMLGGREIGLQNLAYNTAINDILSLLADKGEEK